MLLKALSLGAALLVCAVPAAAQFRGTMEFGAFGSVASFDKELSLESAYGGGGRIGMYLDPRLSFEFEKGEMRASRPNGLRDVNVGIVGGRAVWTPVTAGRLSLLLGAGAGISTETNFLHSYGVDALAGMKFRLSEAAALRLDGVYDFLANEDWKTYRTLRAGLTLYRHANRPLRVVTITPPPRTVMGGDSVSASETRRLRDRDAALSALRDSLRMAPPPVTMMNDAIHFAFGRSEVSDSAKAVLNEQISRLAGYDQVAIVLLVDPAASSNDVALGASRAQAAKAHVVSRGFAADRVFIDARGERPFMDGAGASTRRAILRVLLVGDGIGIRKDGR